MSMFDKIVGAVSGKGEQGGLQQLLGGLNDKSSLGGIIQSLTGSTGSSGLSSIVQRLSQAGLGDTVKSWVGTGANQPVSPEALSGALGQESIAAFAQKFGISPEQASAALAKVLPEAVDKMTPNGQIEEGTV